MFEMGLEPRKRLINGLIAFGKAKASEMLDVAALIKGAKGNGGHLGLGSDVMAELGVIAIKTKRAKIGGKEVASRASHGGKANLLQPLGQAITTRR